MGGRNITRPLFKEYEVVVVRKGFWLCQKHEAAASLSTTAAAASKLESRPLSDLTDKQEPALNFFSKLTLARVW